MSVFREENAPIIVEAHGFHLIDADGRRYLDGHSSLWCNVHGHRVPEIDQAIREQLDKVAHSTLLGLSNGPSIELAAELVRRVPHGLNKVFFADCGAAGVEVALKIAFQYFQQRGGVKKSVTRDKFIYFAGAYHGDTIGTMSLGDISRFKDAFSPLLFPAVWAELPVAIPEDPALEREGLERCVAQLRQILEKHHTSIAGVVIEPLVQAAAGIRIQASGFLKKVEELCREFDTLLIADEIAVGFGRTGTMFACEQEQVSPDILILSKGLTGGYLPLAATLVTVKVYDAFLGEPSLGRTFQHGHTYTGNPLACAAALASIQLLESNRVLDRVGRNETLLNDKLAGLREEPRIKAVRQKGVMVGIDLIPDEASKHQYRVGHRLTLACRERGVIVRNIADTLVLMPAPAMPVELVAQLCDVVIDAIISLD
jgi:adenosylmethionine-8-amino-7-oxononanoate aminotransferase